MYRTVQQGYRATHGIINTAVAVHYCTSALSCWPRCPCGYPPRNECCTSYRESYVPVQHNIPTAVLVLAVVVVERDASEKINGAVTQ